MFENLEIWWVTGAQMLYGEEPVRIVESHSKEMVEGINAAGVLPIKVIYKGTVMSSKDIERVMLDANGDKRCIGIITWMHTFSPAKMWIHGLQQLRKPLLHLHTQYNAEIPWDTMDMDFMNLVKWLSATGKTKRHSRRLPYGAVLQPLGPMLRTCS